MYAKCFSLSESHVSVISHYAGLKHHEAVESIFKLHALAAKNLFLEKVYPDKHKMDSGRFLKSSSTS
jgi:hypothetical protein